VIEGGIGNDTLLFNGSNIGEVLTVFGAAGRAQLSRDVANIQMDTNDVERLELHAIGGADTIRVNDLTGTELKHVAIDLSVSGSPGSPDTNFDGVTVNGGATASTMTITGAAGSIAIQNGGTEITILGADTTDGLTINGLGGNDKIDASGLQPGVIGFTIDGGIGSDTITGSRAADLLLGGDGNDVVTGLQGADVAFLGIGDDRFVWNPGDGSDIVEGQAGADTLQFNGANINERIDI